MIALPQTALNSPESSHTITFAGRLADRIGECNTDMELGVAMEAVEGAVSAGTLSPTLAEELATTAVERGWIIHANTRAITFSIPAEELTSVDLHCPCCGHEESWGGSGASTCNVCHPRVTLSVTRAAAG